MRDVAEEVVKGGSRQIGRMLRGPIFARNSDGMCYPRESSHLQW